MKEIIEVELEAFIQATEDSEKIFAAIQNLIPQELQEENYIINTVRGVYHNPITIVRAKFVRNAKQIIKHIGLNLRDLDKKYLFRSLNRRIDNGNLYIRFAKQALYLDKVEIQEEKDTIKLKIGFSKNYSNKEKMIEILREMELISP